MTIRYLLDTNVLSELSKPAPNGGILRRFRRHILHVATASPVWNELRFGTMRFPPSRRRETLVAYLDNVIRATLPILPYDAAAAEWHAEERVRLQAAGTTAPFVDGQIAAIAHMNDLVLVTSNIKDYSSFHELAFEDWRS